MTEAVDGAEWLLLCDASAALRYRVLTELMNVPPSDPEAADLLTRRSRAPEVAGLLAEEHRDLQGISGQLSRLGYLGYDRSHPRVQELAERLFSRQLSDGSFPLRAFRTDERYSMMPLQVAVPLRGLAAVGFATDPRAERGYEWLLSHRLDDGAWPTGYVAGQPGGVAGYRRLPGSVGCRANTQLALACLVLHPGRAHSEPARRALHLLLQRETRDGWAIGTEVARRLGYQSSSGFLTLYAHFDLAFVLELAAAAGACGRDPRVADLMAFLRERRGPEGLWPHPSHPELARWLTFDLLLSFRKLREGDWAGEGPRLRFRAYPARNRY